MFFFFMVASTIVHMSPRDEVGQDMHKVVIFKEGESLLRLPDSLDEVFTRTSFCAPVLADGKASYFLADEQSALGLIKKCAGTDVVLVDVEELKRVCRHDGESSDLRCSLGYISSQVLISLSEWFFIQCSPFTPNERKYWSAADETSRAMYLNNLTCDHGICVQAYIQASTKYSQTNNELFSKQMEIMKKRVPNIEKLIATQTEDAVNCSKL